MRAAERDVGSPARRNLCSASAGALRSTVSSRSRLSPRRGAQGDPRSAQHRQPLGQFVGVLRQFGDEDLAGHRLPRLPAGRHGHRRVLVGQCAVELGEKLFDLRSERVVVGALDDPAPLSADASVAHLEDLDRRLEFVADRSDVGVARRCRRDDGLLSMARRRAVASSRSRAAFSKSRSCAASRIRDSTSAIILSVRPAGSRRNRRRSRDARRRLTRPMQGAEHLSI